MHVFDTDLIKTAAAIIDHRGETVLLIQRGLLAPAALLTLRRALATVTVVPRDATIG